MCSRPQNPKQSPAKAAVSDDKCRWLYEGLRDAFVSVTMDGRIQEYNEVYRQMLGYEAAELAQLTYQDITPAHWHAMEARIIAEQVLVDDYSAVYEKEYRSKDGRVFPVELRTILLRDERGAPAAMWAIIRDISERKQAEMALREAHDELEQRVAERTAELTKANLHLQAIYDGIIEGLLITDIESRRFVRVNAALCRMLGYTEAELLAASIADIHPPEEVPNDLRRFQAAADGRVSINEDRPVLRKDGSIFYADITGHRIEYNGRPCLLALFRDITERKQIQEALRQSHDELRAIYEGLVDGIVVIALEDPHPLRANAALCRMLGYSEEEVRELSPAQVHPADSMPAVHEHLRELAEQGVARAENMPFLRRDGSVFYADVVSSRIVYNRRLCRISFLHDITERKRTLEALQREQRTLEHMLRSSDHERQLIAYDIHDGLAQYLVGATMQLDVAEQLRKDYPGEAAKAHEAGLLMVRKSLAEARRLISGVRPPILDESGILAALAHLVYEHRGRSGPKIEFHSDVDFGRLAPVLENAIYRIAQEGLANAWKHSQAQSVRVELVQSGEQVRIEIRDTGVGFQLENVDAGRFGLAGIRERARLLGGTAVIVSTPGTGTRITVDLPIMRRRGDER